MELSQTRDKTQHSTESAFTQVKFQCKYCPGVLFQQNRQLQESSQELGRSLLERRENQSRQKEPFNSKGQEYPPQGIRNQVEMDAEIDHRLLAEEQARGQQ